MSNSFSLLHWLKHLERDEPTDTAAIEVDVYLTVATSPVRDVENLLILPADQHNAIPDGSARMRGWQVALESSITRFGRGMRRRPVRRGLERILELASFRHAGFLLGMTRRVQRAKAIVCGLRLCAHGVLAAGNITPTEATRIPLIGATSRHAPPLLPA
jgi:hypothetical protein